MRALGRIIVEIRDMSGYLRGGKGHQPSTQFAAKTLDYPGKRGMPIDRIDAHSLRAGDAKALSLSGFSEYQIQTMGRWRSETY